MFFIQNKHLLNILLFTTISLITFSTAISVRGQSNQLTAGITIEDLETYKDNYYDAADCKLKKLKKPTEEQMNFKKLTDSLDLLKVKPTIRVVFQDETDARDYRCALKELKNHQFKIMGLFLDSFALARYRMKQVGQQILYTDERKTEKKLPIEQRLHNYQNRIDSYLDTLYQDVDIWEVGNEVNGEWADENYEKIKKDSDPLNKHYTPESFAATIQKINYAIKMVKAKYGTLKDKTALTLVYQPNCKEWSSNEMFTWFAHARETGPNLFTLDLSDISYLLVSYYEDKKCDEHGKETICDKKFFDNKEHSELEEGFCVDAVNIKLPKSNKNPDQTLRQIYWNGFFNHLHSEISQSSNPNLKIGFGEVGCRNDSGCSSETDLLTRYYSIRVNQPWFMGGYFWWTTQQDILKSDQFSLALRAEFQKF